MARGKCSLNDSGRLIGEAKAEAGSVLCDTLEEISAALLDEENDKYRELPQCYR